MIKQPVNIIVAHNHSNVIGYKNEIPWDIPADLEYFRQMTEHHVVIMGRKTWDSLPIKPLINRMNIVLSSSPLYHHHLKHQQLSMRCSCWKSMLDMCQANFWCNDRQRFIIGGESIYRQALAMDIVDHIYVTLVHQTNMGDTYFPPLDEKWQGKRTFQGKEFDRIHYERI